MGSTPGVYRATYRDKRTGKLKQASTWLATYWDPHRHRTVKEYGFPTARAAQTRRADLASTAGRLASGDVSAGTITVEQLLALVIDDYEVHARRSTKEARERARLLLESFGPNFLARNVDERAINRHIRRMRSEGYAVATINRSLALLKRGFRLAHRRMPALVVPYIGLLDERANVRQGFFEAKDLERIIAHLPAEARPIIRALHLTGWRRGEILSRKWTDLEGGFLLLRPGETKNGRGRAFPLAPDLGRLLKGVPRTGPLIFRNPPKGADGWLRTAWDRARASAGLPRALMHDLRRTAARDLVRAGVDRDTAKKILGHETDSIFTRYRIVAGDDLQHAATLLSAYRKRPGKGRKKVA